MKCKLRNLGRLRYDAGCPNRMSLRALAVVYSPQIRPALLQRREEGSWRSPPQGTPKPLLQTFLRRIPGNLFCLTATCM